MSYLTWRDSSAEHAVLYGQSLKPQPPEKRVKISENGTGCAMSAIIKVAIPHQYIKPPSIPKNDVPLMSAQYHIDSAN